MNSIPFPSRTIHNNPIERCVMHRKKCNISSLVVRRSPIDASRRKCNLCRPLAREIKSSYFSIPQTRRQTPSIAVCFSKRLLQRRVTTLKTTQLQCEDVLNSELSYKFIDPIKFMWVSGIGIHFRSIMRLLAAW